MTGDKQCAPHLSVYCVLPGSTSPNLLEERSRASKSSLKQAEMGNNSSAVDPTQNPCIKGAGGLDLGPQAFVTRQFSKHNGAHISAAATVKLKWIITMSPGFFKHVALSLEDLDNHFFDRFADELSKSTVWTAKALSAKELIFRRWLKLYLRPSRMF